MTASASDLPDLVAFDLDDTLAPSKAAMPEPMAAALRLLLSQVPVCIISGGQISQFRNQVLTHLGAAPDELARLHLMPTCGTRYYTHAGGRGAGTEESEWTLVYANDLSPAQVAQGFAVVEEQARRLGLWSERTWGPALEDRGSQITFSALGQEAPIDAKRAWDPTGEKRAALRDAVAPLLPGLEVRSGGATSIDITLEGVDKAYGLKRLAAVTGIGLERMLFIGDRLDPEGNDYPVKVLGVPCHAVTGWRDTAEFVTALAGDLAAARKA